MKQVNKKVPEDQELDTFLNLITKSKYHSHIKKYEVCDGLNKNYLHKTYKIKSLLEYVELVTTLTKITEKDFIPFTLIYRGMGNSDYSLIPSIFRENYNLDIDHCEYKMVNELLGLRPATFQHCNSNFELLSEMQHYGLPTRLLDFSLNPLIALFFSCEKQYSYDGRVVLGATYFSDDMKTLGELVCAFYKNQSIHNVPLEELVEEYFFKEYLNRIYLYSETINQIIVCPKYWNERQAKQESVFMIFTNELVDRIAKNFLFDNDNILDKFLFGVEDLKYIYSESIQFLQPSKNRILTEEQKKNFIGFDNTMRKESLKKILEYYDFQHEMPENLKERFVFDVNVKKISEENLKNFFVSILIDKKYKKSIMNDLYNLGIKHSFVYPEIEYLTKDIVGKYKER